MTAVTNGTPAPRLVTLGETMALLSSPRIGPLRHARSLDVGVGGAESNVAVGATRLGVRAAWIGRVGDDEFGRLVRGCLAAEGVDLRAVVTDPHPTGIMIKTRRTATATDVRYYRAGSAGSRLCPDDLDADLIRAAGVLHVTGITPALSASAAAAVAAAVDLAGAAGVTVSLDLNYRRALWPPEAAGPALRGLVRRADLVFATEAEARLVVDGVDPVALARALAALGPRRVVVKRGAHGAVAVADDAVHTAPAHPVEAVDPVGAGDAFAAGYLAEELAGCDAAACLATATAAGAFAVTVSGDWEGLPERADLALLDAGEAVRR
ncbi:MAG TPA: sugar kinase [Pilimelia sp.]|nr:sugar kinase [Pilimelia sp.]